MGKGDKKSKKGKRWRGSFGIARSRASIRARIKRINGPKAVVVAAVESVEAKPKAKRTVKKKSETAE